MVDGWSQLGVVSGLDDVTSGGCLVLDVGLLEDSLRLPTEWFEDRDGLPALTGQQVWGVGTVEHVVAWVVDAGAEVDGEGTFSDVVGVQGFLGSERRSLAISELDHHRGSKEQTSPSELAVGGKQKDAAEMVTSMPALLPSIEY